jgi:hypothetical protein
MRRQVIKINILGSRVREVFEGLVSGEVAKDKGPSKRNGFRFKNSG